MSKTRQRPLDKALRVIDAVRRTCDEKMPSQHVAAFLYIACNDGCSMADLADYMGQAQSSISRAVATLGSFKVLSKSKRAGYGLINAEEDPRERRRKLLRLTAKGRSLAKEIGEILSG